MPDVKMRKQVLQAASFLFILCAVLGLYIVYLSAWEARELAGHPLNQRNAATVADIRRGSILTADGKVLAVSEADGRRSYPLGEEAAAVTGYNSERLGGAGLEAHRNQELLGLTADMAQLGPLTQLLQSGQGNDLVTTIDSRAQMTAYEALSETGHKGAVVVLDARTGAVLAMVSLPACDPNTLEDDWENLQEDKDSPLLNRAVQGLYPPGSTIKPLTAAAALQNNAVDARESFDCTGHLDLGGGEDIHDYHGEVHGVLNLRQALAESCNVFFGTLGLRLGGAKLGKVFSDFGFDQEIGGEIIMTSSHLPEFKEIGQGDLAQTAIGQASLLVTPMHMALLASAFANQGEIMQPYLVQQIVRPGGSVVEEAEAKSWRKALSPSLAGEINDYLATVVESGTGTAAAVREVKVTGKTGTAENSSGEDHAWFIGTAELPYRTLAFAIIVENGGSGGGVAAPIARSIIEALL